MISEEWIPQYGPEGFSAATVFCGEQPAFAELIARHFNVTFPTAFDIEWEVFGKYRIPGYVFPLRVLVDREGNVAFKARTEEYDPEGGECPKGDGACPCDGRGELCETIDAIEAELGI